MKPESTKITRVGSGTRVTKRQRSEERKKHQNFQTQPDVPKREQIGTSPDADCARNNYLEDFAIEVKKFGENLNSNSGSGSSPVEGIINPLSQQPLILAQTKTFVTTGKPVSAMAIENRQSSFGLITSVATPNTHFYPKNKMLETKLETRKSSKKPSP